MTEQEKREWDQLVTRYRQQALEIRIPGNIEPGEARVLSSKLNDLYSEIRIVYGTILKQTKETERLIYRIENKSKTGSNEGVRRNNMILAVENAERGNGTTVNLYDLETELNNKKEDISAILDVIEKKSGLVWTMTGLLKVESTFARG